MQLHFENDLISIVTPVYNTGSFLRETIQSVLSQTYPNWELIAVDDCSIDNSRKILQQMEASDPRIKPIYLEQNQGAARARNIAVRESVGRYIAFLDSDDAWYPTKLETQLRIMIENQHPITYASYKVIDANGKDTKKTVRAMHPLTLNDYMRNTVIGFSTAMIDRKFVGNFEFYDIRMKQDFQLWINLLSRGFIAYNIDEILGEYRIHNKSLSANKIKAAAQVWNVMYRIEGIGLLKSLYFFFFYASNAMLKRLFGK
jgi:teichuronic acid biosynthesis glycosyltransferase TuaG